MTEYIILQYNLLFFLDYINKTPLSNLGNRPSTSTKQNFNDDLKIKSLIPKPYSSTKYNNNIHKSMNEVLPQSNLVITPRGTNNSSDKHSGKILFVVLILIT